MGPISKYKIDSEALRRELEVRNLSFKEASEAMGYSKTYLSKIINRGADIIPKTAALLLENLYNIKPEAYVIPDKPEPVQEWDPLQELEANLVIDPERLEEIIYQAVKRALIEVREHEEER